MWVFPDWSLVYSLHSIIATFVTWMLKFSQTYVEVLGKPPLQPTINDEQPWIHFAFNIDKITASVCANKLNARLNRIKAILTLFPFERTRSTYFQHAVLCIYIRRKSTAESTRSQSRTICEKYYTELFCALTVYRTDIRIDGVETGVGNCIVTYYYYHMNTFRHHQWSQLNYILRVRWLQIAINRISLFECGVVALLTFFLWLAWLSSLWKSFHFSINQLLRRGTATTDERREHLNHLFIRTRQKGI